MKHRLLDTGPMVAYLDAADARHATAIKQINAFRGKYFCTDAVIVEATFFVQKARHGLARLREFLDAGEIKICQACSLDALTAASELVEKYRDAPMDFADATLLLLADALNIGEITTFDHRGFTIYRTRKGKALRIAV